MADIEVHIASTEGLRRVGTLHRQARRGGEAVAFAYHPDWLADVGESSGGEEFLKRLVNVRLAKGISGTQWQKPVEGVPRLTPRMQQQDRRSGDGAGRHVRKGYAGREVKLADALAQLIEDTSLRAGMAVNAHRLAQQFAPRKVALQLEAAYAAISGNHVHSLPV